MQTQCPHCDTRFRITETQLNIADGLVRCGVCEEVFNAFEIARQDNQQPSLLNDERSDEPSAFEEAETEVMDLHDIQATRHDDKSDENIENPADNEPVIFSETPEADESKEDTFNFFDEDLSESQQHLVPEKFRDSDSSRSRSLVSTVLWSLGILFLTTTLIIEYIWFNRDQLNQMPELQVWVEKLCQQVSCKSIAVRDPAKIELVTRNVYSHPNEKNALMVNVTMKNNADFAQPYPTLQIDFSDIRGGTVAARRFLPNEYLAVDNQQFNDKQPRLLLPGHSTNLSMEIRDPGKQAMTYEFNFL